MKKAVIICSAGMSSSLMAKKTTDSFKQKGIDLDVSAVNLSDANNVIDNAEYDLYLISPQTKMYFDKFSKAVSAINKKIAIIPPQAYVPIPTGINKLSEIISKELEL